MLAYESDVLQAVQQHIDNAMLILFDGLHEIGQLLGRTPINKKMDGLNELGFFISAITNLAEALKDLRLDTDHVLKEREVMNY